MQRGFARAPCRGTPVTQAKHSGDKIVMFQHSGDIEYRSIVRRSQMVMRKRNTKEYNIMHPERITNLSETAGEAHHQVSVLVVQVAVAVAAAAVAPVAVTVGLFAVPFVGLSVGLYVVYVSVLLRLLLLWCLVLVGAQQRLFYEVA